MEGTIFISGIEIKAFFVVGLGILCCMLALSTIIFYVLWIKEVIRRKGKEEKLSKEIRNLLEEIKSSFSQEIFLAVGRVMEAMNGIISDLERGKRLVILKNFTSELLKGFSGSILADLCSCLNTLGVDVKRRAEIENIYSEGDGAEIGAYISSISISIRNMGVLIGDYEVKNIYDAILQCSERDRAIEGLRNNTEKLRQSM